MAKVVCFNVMKETIRTNARRIGMLSALRAAEPLQMSLLKPRQVRVISRRLTPIKISTAVGEESAHLSSTTLLIQSRY